MCKGGCMILVKQASNSTQVELKFPYAEYFVNAVKALPYRSWNMQKQTWTITKPELPQLIRNVGLYNFSFETQQLHDQFVKPSTRKVDNTRKRLTEVKLIRPYSFKIQPLPHQIEAFNCGITNEQMIIGDEMGLGKTFEAISIACYRKSVGQVKKCLIVCGVNSTKYNWAEEVEKHSNEKAIVFDQKPMAKKIETIKEWENNDVFFGIINIEALRPKKINRSAVKRYISGYKGIETVQASEITKLLRSVSDMVIADEIHKMKNVTSGQGIALQQLNTKYKIGLSGTPLTNHIEDLWGILRWVNGTYVNFWYFRDRYCVLGGYGGKEIVGYKNLQELADSMKEVMLRRTKEEVLNLPEKLYKTEYVELKPTTMKYYNEVKSGVVRKLTATGNLKTISLKSVLTSMVRLRQMTEGIDAVDKKAKLMEDNPKLERIKEMLADDIVIHGKKAIIFSCWETTANIYRKALKEYNPAYITGKVDIADRQKEVNRFQNDDTCKVAIGTIGAMGTGLTMTAAEYVIFVDKYWNQTDNIQAEDRAHRIGAKSNVTIISMVAKDTIDEEIEELLKEKENLFELIVNGGAATANANDIKSRILGIAI